MASKLTEGQILESRDLGQHASARAMRAFDDAACLVSDRRQRAAIALHVLAAIAGMTAAEIDKAEGRKSNAGEISAEAAALIVSVFEGLAAPAGRAALDHGWRMRRNDIAGVVDDDQWELIARRRVLGEAGERGGDG